MQPCVAGSSTQRWWKDYHSGANGNFLLKFLFYDDALKISQPKCAFARDVGPHGSNGRYFAKEGSDHDQRRLVGWGDCDPENYNHRARRDTPPTRARAAPGRRSVPSML